VQRSTWMAPVLPRFSKSRFSSVFSEWNLPA